MIKTQISLWKIIEGNGRLKVRVRVSFLLFYSEVAPTDPWFNMLQTLLGRKYEEEMSYEHPLTEEILNGKLHFCAVFMIQIESWTSFTNLQWPLTFALLHHTTHTTKNHILSHRLIQ